MLLLPGSQLVYDLNAKLNLADPQNFWQTKKVTKETDKRKNRKGLFVVIS